MSFSRMAGAGFSERIFTKFKIRLNWKLIALISAPLAIAGVCYCVHRRRSACSANQEIELLPSTPLDAAIALKNRGNKFFKAGRYAQAVECYDKALEKCPSDALFDRSTFYQNRAAAQQNLRQYEAALADCSSALELSPKYLKALNRRSCLYDKLDRLDECLLDVTACCILEQFRNTDNVILMDQTLKKLGEGKAKQEFANLPHNLPSVAFTRDYLSAFAWDPFVSKIESKRKFSESTEETKETGELISSTDPPAEVVPDRRALPEYLRSAYEALDSAIELMRSNDYVNSQILSTKAVSLFASALSELPSSRMTDCHGAAEGDEAILPSVQDTVIVPDQVNGAGGGGGVEAEHPVLGDADGGNANWDNNAGLLSGNTASLRSQALAAHAKGMLLQATYLALSGQSEQAKQQLQLVAAEDSGASTVVRVNALIKSACLSMSVDQDLAACLYDFQRAQNLCPECPDVYLHRGQINLLADQLDEALHDLNMAVKLKPDFSIAQSQRLYTLYRRALSDSDPDAVQNRIEDFQRLVKKYPTCLEAHSLYAQVLTERGLFERSDEQFARVIELAPTSGMAYAHRGLLQLRWKQDREAAHKWFTKGAKADPHCELVHELLGQLAVERGQFEEALEHFRLAICEAKTQNDLAHLIALREGVKAQLRVCEIYDISITDVLSSIQREQAQMMSAAAAMQS